MIRNLKSIYILYLKNLITLNDNKQLSEVNKSMHKCFYKF